MATVGVCVAQVMQFDPPPPPPMGAPSQMGPPQQIDPSQMMDPQMMVGAPPPQPQNVRTILRTKDEFKNNNVL